jgi:hypothetical protein
MTVETSTTMAAATATKENTKPISQNNQNNDNSNALSNNRNKNHNRRRNHSHKKDGNLLSKRKMDYDTNKTTLKKKDENLCPSLSADPRGDNPQQFMTNAKKGKVTQYGEL